MPLAGFLAERDEMAFWPIVIAGSVGSVAGALGWYWVGRSVGERRFRKWVDEHGRWLTLSCDDLDRAKDWFGRHGGSAVFIGRLIPGIRTFVSVPAGFAEMPFGPFLLYSTLGTAMWTTALAVAGRLLGSRYDQVSTYLEPVSWAILAGIAALYVYRVVRWKRGDAEEDEPEAACA
jgi:membrane protein DedA with SNARE-associated domain